MQLLSRVGDAAASQDTRWCIELHCTEWLVCALVQYCNTKDKQDGTMGLNCLVLSRNLLSFGHFFRSKYYAPCKDTWPERIEGSWILEGVFLNGPKLRYLKDRLLLPYGIKFGNPPQDFWPRARLSDLSRKEKLTTEHEVSYRMIV